MISMIADIVFILEILFSNMIVFDACSERKYSYKAVVTVITAFTALYFACVCLLSAYLPVLVEDVRLLAVLGLSYMLPLYFLYRENLKRIFVVICICWSFNYGAMVIVMLLWRIPEISGAGGVLYAVIVRTAIFALILAPKYRYIMPKLKFIIKNIHEYTKGGNLYLAAASILYFCNMVILNNIFSDGGRIYLGMISMIFMELMVFGYYTLIGYLQEGELKVMRMAKEAGIDYLTGVGNRSALISELERLTGENERFSVLFADLDNFKKINDEYGHIMGDAYLKRFADCAGEIFEDLGSVYRFGGDEFVIIYYGKVSRMEAEKLKRCENWGGVTPNTFYGASVGFMHCTPPHMGTDEILKRVDNLMYEQKNNRKGASGNI